jgi:hypothetical protein
MGLPGLPKNLRRDALKHWFSLARTHSAFLLRPFDGGPQGMKFPGDDFPVFPDVKGLLNIFDLLTSPCLVCFPCTGSTTSLLMAGLDFLVFGEA